MYDKEIRISESLCCGYRYFYDSSHPLAREGIVYLHRHLASLKIGRWLLPGETVHHRNGDRLDNSDENLEVLASGSEHARLHNPPMPTRSCPICGMDFGGWKRSQRYCSPQCVGVAERKVVRPSKEQLELDLESMSWMAIGRKYGVTDNSVRKWARGNGLL